MKSLRTQRFLRLDCRSFGEKGEFHRRERGGNLMKSLRSPRSLRLDSRSFSEVSSWRQNAPILLL